MSEIVLGSATRNLGARLANMLDDDQWNNLQEFLEAVNGEIKSLRSQLTEAMELTNDRAAEIVEANAKIAELKIQLRASQSQQDVIRATKDVEIDEYEQALVKLQARFDNAEPVSSLMPNADSAHHPLENNEMTSEWNEAIEAAASVVEHILKEGGGTYADAILALRKEDPVLPDVEPVALFNLHVITHPTAGILLNVVPIKSIDLADGTYQLFLRPPTNPENASAPPPIFNKGELK